MSAEELAQKTGTNARYIREWLANQAAGGYVEYDEASDTYYLNEEQELCLADPNGPVDLVGAYQIVQDLFYVRERAVENFRSGDGMEWGEHHRCLFYGTERFFRGGYNANLVSSWLPALDGVVEKLTAGGRAADVGCGHGASTILMAQAFPNSQFVGIDYHGASIETARERAAKAGVGNASFELADATSYRGDDYDLIAFFDCLHDMADPSGAARHARAALKPDGHCLLVEPFAGDSVAENLNPVGRLYYGASSLICVPVSLARHGPALGRASRGAAVEESDGRRWWVHAVPARDADTVQPDFRGAALTAISTALCAGSPRGNAPRARPDFTVPVRPGIPGMRRDVR